MVAPTGVILVVVIRIVAVTPVVIVIAIVVVVILVIAVVGHLTGHEVVDIDLDRDHHRDGIDGINGAYNGRGRYHGGSHRTGGDWG